MKLSSSFLVLSSVLLMALPSWAEQYPGKGSEQTWQTYSSPSSSFTLRYPSGWQVSTDPQTGQINIAHPDGSKLSVLPFSTAKAIDPAKAPELMNAMLKVLSPTENWTKADTAGSNFYKSTAVNGNEKLAAVLVLAATPQGSFGKLCIARTTSKVSSGDANAFAEIMGSLRFNQQYAAQQNAAMQQGAQPAPQQQQLMQQPQVLQQMTQSGLPPTPFAGYTVFVDPSEHSYEVEVPRGWKTEGGLTRGSAIDARPWVRVSSPDGLITAFIGDGSIPPFSIPTALGTQLGYGVGRAYGGGIVKPYIPAQKFVRSYVNEKLKRMISNLQVLEQNEHPDLARLVNGTVGATRSECSSIKISGMYKNIPAVGYFIAATKATVASGAGMWWVTYVAGELGPADRDAGGLSVILHMMQTFHLDPQWQGQSLKTTGEVSRQYTAASQQMSKVISDRYWSQQAFNDRMNQGYWNRQAVQDHAANNFSDYIRGQQTVEDPQSGNQYKVQYGPQYHWIDPGGNVMGTEYSSPGAEWRQLMAVP